MRRRRFELNLNNGCHSSKDVVLTRVHQCVANYVKIATSVDYKHTIKMTGINAVKKNMVVPAKQRTNEMSLKNS